MLPNRPVTRISYTLASLCLLSHFVFLQKEAHSQEGLVGNNYFTVGYQALRPNSHDLRAISSWSHGVEIIGNIPLSSTLDWHSSLITSTFDGTANVNSTEIYVDFDIIQLDTVIIKHFAPYGNIDPYVGLGVGYAEHSADFASNTGSISLQENNFGIGWRAGIEWRLTSNFAILTQIRGADALDDFDVTDVLIDSIFAESRMVYWLDDRFLCGFVIGSDFDDTEIKLGAYFGVGRF